MNRIFYPLFAAFQLMGGALTMAASPTVTEVVIDDGTSQRSTVRSINLTFSEDVGATLAPEVITLTNLNDSSTSSTAVSFDAGTLKASITFPDAVGGVLPNGNYRLTLSGADISNETGDLLDGDADGNGGDDYVTFTFRYFGDFDGDRDVDFQDTARFRAAYPSVAADANYRADADNDMDGDIDAADLAAFKETYLSTLSGVVEAPTIIDPPSITGDNEVTLTGKTSASSTVVVSNGDNVYRVFSDENGNFTITIPLFRNRINHIFVRGDGFKGDLSALTPVNITQDSQAPFLFVDVPMDGAELSSETITVTGRTGDLLGGFSGLSVTVNGEPARIIAGVGTNGTFERKLVPLQSGENTLTIIATDSLGNSLTRIVKVSRLANPQIQIIAGNDQHAERNTELTQPVVVKLTDVGGKAFAGKIVTFHVARSDGRLAATAGQTDVDGPMMLQVRSDAQGMARAYWSLGSDAGQSNNQLTVTSAGLRGAALFTASANCRPPSQINVGATGGNQIGEAGAIAAQPLNAWVSDNLNGVPGIQVTFKIVSGEGSLNGQQFLTTSTDGTGHTIAMLRLGESGGEVRVEANFSGNTAAPATFIARGLVRDPSKPTSFSGVVLDNSNLPIGGVKLILTTNGIPHGPVTSNPDGAFTFPSVIAGTGGLDVDGTTATHLNGNQLAQGRRFPKLHYQVTLVPNAENTLPTTVMLPTLDPANERIYDGTKDIELTIKGIAGFKMLVKAGSMTLPDGTRPSPENPTILSLNQVHADNIPMPIQDGVASLLTWTLQPGGAHFDPPVAVTYPNMSSLPPGAIANILSFNHSTERFEVVASAKVTEDGSVINTVPGSGITTSGWGGNCPPYSVTGDSEGPFLLNIVDDSTGGEQIFNAEPEGGSDNYSYTWTVGGSVISTSKTLRLPQPKDNAIIMLDAILKVVDEGGGGVVRRETVPISIPVGLTVDANRDGKVEFTTGTDQTSLSSPYEFWVNNDQDKGYDDEGDDIYPDSNDYGEPDYRDDRINDLRDLEDFSRIQLKVEALLEALKSGEIQLAIKFKEGTTTGNPAINLWLHLDEDGRRDYVEDEESALKHVGIPGQKIGLSNPGRVTKNRGYTFEVSFWNGSLLQGYKEISTFEPERYLLFEGASEGKGELVMEFRKGNVVLGEGGSCWIELKDIKQMYEEYTMAGIYGKSWQQINQIAPTADTNDLSDGERAVYDNFELPQVFEYPVPSLGGPDYEKDYILFVHGWRMKPSEKYAFAETAFKRLWHRGYRGRFGMFSWPTEWTNRESPLAIPDGILWDPRNYDRSDRKAYLSGKALNALLHRLNNIYPGRVRMFAHSMGNVVASQSLRNEVIKSDHNEIIHTYAACQAASVAFAYDSTNPRTMTHEYISDHPGVTGAIQAGATFTAPESPEIPEIYGGFSPQRSEKREYFNSINTVVSNNIINVHNWTDSALAAWMVGQWQKPDVGWGYGELPIAPWQYTLDKKWYRGEITAGSIKDGTPPTLDGRELILGEDTYEIFAHLAEAKSPALGASVEGGNETANVVSKNLDTMTAFSSRQSFDGDEEDHSAQFGSINMRRWEFWDRLLQDRNLFDIQTDYPEANE